MAPKNQEKEKLLGPACQYDVHSVSATKYGNAAESDTTTSTTEGLKRKSPTCYCTTIFVTVSVALLLLSATLLLVCIIGYSSCDSTEISQLGCDNDTVEVALLNSFFYSHVTVYECLKRNDYSHEGDIFVVNLKDLKTHNVSTLYKSIIYEQPYSSDTTGRVDYLYFVKGSRIEYTICLASETNLEQTGDLYIFDDQIKYRNYAANPDVGDKLSVLSSTLAIGAANTTVCNTVHFNVTHSTYLFIVSRAPASIHYYYTLATYSVFYDHKDYQSRCHTGGGSCDIALPGGFFHPQTSQILAYIYPPVAADPFSTHICITPHISTTFTVILFTTASVTAILVVLVIGLVVLRVALRYHRRERIKVVEYMVINS